MEEKELRKHQIKQLEQFCEQVSSWPQQPWQKVFFIGAMVLMAVSMGLLLWDEEGGRVSSIAIFGFSNTFNYGTVQFTLGKKWSEARKLWRNITLYLPVSARMLLVYRLKKLLTFSLCFYLIGQMTHLIRALSTEHKLVWENFWYPFLYLFFLPFVLVAFYLWGISMGKKAGD